MALATRAIAAAAEQGKKQTRAQAQRDAQRQSSAVAKRSEPKIAVATDVSIKPVNLEETRKIPELNAAHLADLIENVFLNWARWENPYHPTIAALWTMSNWMTDGNRDHPVMLFDAHPRLFMIADKGSGKTRTMKLVRAMSRNPTIISNMVTAPGLRDALYAGCTVFLDEVDRMIGRGMGKLEVQGLIAAYTLDSGSINGIGGLNQQGAYGPMMLAAKPRILTGTGGYVEDLFERSFILPIKKHAKQSDPIPDLDDDFTEITTAISKVLGLWADAIRPEEGKLRPIHTVPEKLTGRMREISSPLLAVADRAVDPRLLRTEGEDTRWAVKARTAVQNVLLGHGDNAQEIMADLDDRLKELGIM